MRKLVCSAVIVSFAVLAASAPADCPCQARGNGENVATKSLTGKVTQVNDRAKKIAVLSHKKTYWFSCRDVSQPKLGDVVEVSYYEGGGGLPRATSISVTKATAD